jgi:hypothetical protein
MKKSSVFFAIFFVVIIIGGILVFGDNPNDGNSVAMNDQNIAATGDQEFIINDIPFDLPRSVSVGLVSFANESPNNFGKKDWTIETEDGGKIKWGGEGAQNCATLISMYPNGISECMDVKDSAVYIEKDDATLGSLEVFRKMESQL